jgi:uncharacterized protein YjbI with pentapeptide repeats
VSGRPRKELIAVSRVQLAEALHKHAWFRESRPRGQRAVLIDCDLAGISLAGLDLSQADLTGSSFRGASLVGCHFDMATAFCCDFSQANLENSSFKRADLRGSRFAGAVLIGANLFEADLREGGQVSRDRKGEFFVQGGTDDPANGPGVDFKGANLTNAILHQVMAVRTDFSDATMRGTKLVRAHLQGANFTNCDLEAADFAQADMRAACFRGAVLSHANLEYANTAGADMEDVLSEKPQGRLLDELPVSVEEMRRQHTRFIASHGATGALLDLSGFDLRGSGSWAGVCLTMARAVGAVFQRLDLSGAALQAAKCQGADFRNCQFDAADMRGVSLAGARLNNASLRKVDLRALLMDQGMRMAADLSNASLRNADLSGALLQGARFAGADLSFANLTEVDFTGVDLAGATLVGCKMSRAQTAAVASLGTIVSPTPPLVVVPNKVT